MQCTLNKCHGDVYTGCEVKKRQILTLRPPIVCGLHQQLQSKKHYLLSTGRTMEKFVCLPALRHYYIYLNILCDRYLTFLKYFKKQSPIFLPAKSNGSDLSLWCSSGFGVLFDADPDPDPEFNFMWMRIRIRLFTLMRIRIRILASKQRLKPLKKCSNRHIHT
jgi:hypothetical protein